MPGTLGGQSRAPSMIGEQNEERERKELWTCRDTFASVAFPGSVPVNGTLMVPPPPPKSAKKMIEIEEKRDLGLRS